MLRLPLATRSFVRRADLQHTTRTLKIHRPPCANNPLIFSLFLLFVRFELAVSREGVAVYGVVAAVRSRTVVLYSNGKYEFGHKNRAHT